MTSLPIGDLDAERGPRIDLAYAIVGVASAIGIGVFGLWAIPFSDDLARLSRDWPIAGWVAALWPQPATLTFCGLGAVVLGNALRSYACWRYGWRSQGRLGAPTAAETGGPDAVGTPLVCVAGGLLSALGATIVVVVIAAVALGTAAPTWTPFPTEASQCWSPCPAWTWPAWSRHSGQAVPPGDAAGPGPGTGLQTGGHAPPVHFRHSHR